MEALAVSKRAIGLLLIEVGLLAISFSMGWKIKAWKDDAAYKNQYEQLINQFNEKQKKTAQIELSYKEEISLLEKDQIKIKNKVIDEINSNPDYNRCIVPARGVRLLNSIITETNKSFTSA